MKRLFALCLFIGTVTGVPSVSHGAYKGRVVDADTKEPVEGVVVYMEWVAPHWPEGHDDVGAYETITDKEGKFSLSRYWSINLWKMAWADNLLTIFKSGYEPISGSSWRYFLKIEWGAPKGKYIWKIEHGKPVILLRKSSGDIEKRLSNLDAAYPDGPEGTGQLLLREWKEEHEFLLTCRKANRQC